MDPIYVIWEKYNMDVIEETAQAIGAEYLTAHMGLCKAGAMGDAGCFSFYPSKNIGVAGNAGLIVCRHETLAKRLRICRQRGMEPRYHHQLVGGNFRLDETQAAILSMKLPHLDRRSGARRVAADFYRSEFKSRAYSGK